MIQRLTLDNFQSHKATELEFTPGVNIIVGQSNSGKTAILRSLYWLLENRPLGSGFVSHWNLRVNKKGETTDDLLAPTRVELVTDTATLVREKSQDFNGYRVDGKPLEAVGTSVPEEIGALSGLTSVNVQKQMDAPFLLSDGAGEVARFFNKIIRLDLIDRVLSKAESKRRSLNSALPDLQQLASNQEGQLKDLEWIDVVTPLLEKARGIDGDLRTRKQEFARLTVLIGDLKKTAGDLGALNPLLNLDIIVSRASEARAQLTTLNKQRTILGGLVKELGDISRDRETLQALDGLRTLVEPALGLLKVREDLGARVEKITRLKREYKDTVRGILQAESDFKELTARLPETCPTCGQPYGGQHEDIAHR